MVRRWALDRAMFANVHMLPRDRQGKPTQQIFKPEHFLGTETREVKKVDPLDEYREKMAVMKANAALSRIKKGAPPPEGLSDLWTAPYKGGVN